MCFTLVTDKLWDIIQVPEFYDRLNELIDDFREDFDREAREIDVYGTIPAYGGPVLMIHGDQDAVVPIGYSEKALSVYRDVRLTVIPGAGHGYDGADSAAAREYSIEFIRGQM